MSNLGEFLRTKRLEAGLTVQDIANRTAIRVHIIELLEEGEFEKLPSYVYAHGFVEQYSKVLGLDFQNVVKPMFDEECNKEHFGHAAYQLESAAESTKDYNVKPLNRKLIAIGAIGAVIVVLVIILVVMLNKSGKPAEDSVMITVPPSVLVPEPVAEPELPSDLPPEILPVDEGSSPEEPQNGVGEATYRAELTFSDKCWINYLSDDGSTEDYIAEAGQQKYIYFHNYFRIHVGDAAAVKVAFANDIYANFGNSGQPLRNIYFIRNDDGKLTRSRAAPDAQ